MEDVPIERPYTSLIDIIVALSTMDVTFRGP
jgi:hypothetical protein